MVKEAHRMNKKSFTHRRDAVRVAGALSATAALALAACSSSGGSSGSGASSTKSITVAMVTAPGFGPCAASVSEAWKQKTGVTVNLVDIPYPSLLPKLLTAASAGSSSYDLVTIAFQWTGQLASIGYLTDLSSDMAKDPNASAIAPAEAKALEYQGKNYAVPFLSQVSMLFYRTDILSKAGLTPPTTQAELMSDIAKLKTDGAMPSGMSPIELQGSNGQGTAIFNPVYHALGGGSISTSSGGSNLNAATTQQTLTDLQYMVSNAPSGVLNADSAAVVANFENGGSAMMETFSADPGTSFDTPGASNKIYGNYSATAIPGGAGDYGGWGLAVPASSNNKAEAYAFASYLASPAVDLKCSIANGKGPADTATMSNPSFLKAFPYLKDYPSIIAGAAVRFTGPDAGNQNTALDTAVSQFLTGSLGNPAAAAPKVVSAVAAASKSG
jgi:ABC-type glycerol-3-phosphate transport system substrate-binding protein